MSARITVLLALTVAASPAAAQSTAPKAPAKTIEAFFEAWDVPVARRAAQMIATPAQWNRSDASECSPKATTFSLRCALELAVDEAAAAHSLAKQHTGAISPICKFQQAGIPIDSDCGEFFDEEPIFSMEREKADTSGVWQKNLTPSEMWRGKMTNPGNPVLDAARKAVDVIAPGKYKNARLAQFNDDTSVTFQTLQEYFRAIEDRVTNLTPAQMMASSDDVMIEIYSGGKGIMRTYTGWYNVTEFSATASGVRFQVDTAHEILTSPLDREIVKRADEILSSDAIWNRADNRKCAPNATTWSIYCAMERATRELTGGFHHRRPALEAVRILVEERTKDRKYNHRLMDYNNDKTTVLADVHSLFAEALARMTLKE